MKKAITEELKKSKESEEVSLAKTEVASKTNETQGDKDDVGATEELSLSVGFKRRSSIITRISNIYFILTLTNLVFFWVITGADKMRLISEKAILSTNTLTYELVRRLGPLLMEDPKKLDILLAKKSSAKKKEKVFKAIKDSLKKVKQSDVLLVNRYALATSTGELLHQYPDAWLGEKNLDNKETFQDLLKALQLKELKNQAFYSSPELLKDHIEIYIPVSSKTAEDVVFITRIPMEAIQKELDGLFILALSMVGLMLFVQGIFGFIIYRSIINPIKRLVKGAEAVAHEDLTVTIKKGKKDDELDQLIFTFNVMVAVLDDKTKKLNSTIGELAKKDQVIQDELDMAQDIQQGILPNLKFSDRIEAGVYYAALEKVSGDYYDLFALPNDAIGILMTDASGHGVPAALVTIMAKVHFADLSERFINPAEMFMNANSALANSISTADYMTGFYAVLKNNLEMEFANASHQKGFILRSQSGEVDELSVPGFLLGAVEEAPIPYEMGKIQLEPNDRIILYTDGIVEGENPNKELYGTPRFIEKIKEFHNQSIDEMISNLIEDLDNFAQGAPRKDDVTLFIIEVKENILDLEQIHENGVLNYKEKNYEAAILDFVQLLDTDKEDSKLYLYLGNSYLACKKYQEALKQYEKYITLNSENPGILLKIGMCQSMLKNNDKAVDYFEKSLSLKEDYGPAYAHMAQTYLKKDDKASGLKYINLALAIHPQNKKFLKLQMLLEKEK